MNKLHFNKKVRTKIKASRAFTAPKGRETKISREDGGSPAAGKPYEALRYHYASPGNDSAASRNRSANPRNDSAASRNRPATSRNGSATSRNRSAAFRTPFLILCKNKKSKNKK